MYYCSKCKKIFRDEFKAADHLAESHGAEKKVEGPGDEIGNRKYIYEGEEYEEDEFDIENMESGVDKLIKSVSFLGRSKEMVCLGCGKVYISAEAVADILDSPDIWTKVQSKHLPEGK